MVVESGKSISSSWRPFHQQISSDRQEQQMVGGRGPGGGVKKEEPVKRTHENLSS